MPSPPKRRKEAGSLTHTSEPKLDATTEREREREGVRDHLIVNFDFFVKATNKLEDAANGAARRCPIQKRVGRVAGQPT